MSKGERLRPQREEDRQTRDKKNVQTGPPPFHVEGFLFCSSRERASCCATIRHSRRSAAELCSASMIAGGSEGSGSAHLLTASRSTKTSE